MQIKVTLKNLHFILIQHILSLIGLNAMMSFLIDWCIRNPVPNSLLAPQLYISEKFRVSMVPECSHLISCSAISLIEYFNATSLTWCNAPALPRLKTFQVANFQLNFLNLFDFRLGFILLDTVWWSLFWWGRCDLPSPNPLIRTGGPAFFLCCIEFVTMWFLRDRVVSPTPTSFH